MVFLVRLCLDQDVADSLHDLSEAQPLRRLEVFVLCVTPRLRVGFELDEEHSPPVLREHVVDFTDAWLGWSDQTRSRLIGSSGSISSWSATPVTSSTTPFR